jgi:hypothetical protein
MSDYSYLETELTLAAPADAADLERLRRECGAQVPEQYLAFLKAHDGAEGAVGVLHRAAEVGRAEDFYPELDHLRRLVVFGSNGGLEAFCFNPSGAVVVLPWIGGPEDTIPQGSFSEFLRRLVEQRLFDRDA